ncbi:hypothetical protein [Leptospira sp. GIMC2001]|uniref:hypothetical protein n=1 Tax=Leptospira sp. GIMC2001 TaxID=1513297 RepID=UPI0023494BBD|nr:hypothetical protein [Leptospira sp. GIMC2001]WCL49084.1 hypothetical protein O4O04_17610 [Leptospira sp. GIMC2001]
MRDSMEWGKNRTIKVCTFYEPGISSEEIQELFVHWNDELKLYSLAVVAINQQEIERPGLTGASILEFLYTLPMSENCDRYLYLKGRNWKDIVFEITSLGVFALAGIKLEIQGAVEAKTNTRGYIKAKYISLLQLIFTSPKSTLVHEGYHLLGCGHQLFLDPCYKQIQDTKKLASERESEIFNQGSKELSVAEHSELDSNSLNEELIHPSIDSIFFPSITASGRRFITRDQVDRSILKD